MRKQKRIINVVPVVVEAERKEKKYIFKVKNRLNTISFLQARAALLIHPSLDLFVQRQ